MLIARQGHDSCASRKWIENNTHPYTHWHTRDSLFISWFCVKQLTAASWMWLLPSRERARKSLKWFCYYYMCMCSNFWPIKPKTKERRKENKRTIREEIERKLCQKRKGNPTGTTPSSSCVMCGIYPSRFHPSWCDKSRNANERSMVSFFKNISQLLHSLVIVWSDPKDACIIIGSVRGSMCFVTFFFSPSPRLCLVTLLFWFVYHFV